MYNHQRSEGKRVLAQWLGDFTQIIISQQFHNCKYQYRYYPWKMLDPKMDLANPQFARNRKQQGDEELGDSESMEQGEERIFHLIH